MIDPTPTDVASVLCRLALEHQDDPKAPHVPESDGAYFEAIEQAYADHIDKQERAIADLKRRLEIAKLGVARLQGEIAAAVGRTVLAPCRKCVVLERHSRSLTLALRCCAGALAISVGALGVWIVARWAA